MSRGAWIPIRTFSPMIDEHRHLDVVADHDALVGLPVRTSMRFLRASRRTIDPSDRFHAPATGASDRSHRSARLPASHGTTLPAPAAQPDPHVGPTGPHRRLDRPPARGDRAADRGLQARRTSCSRTTPRARAGTGTDFDDEIDLRAEDDALIAAELEAAEAARAEEEARRAAEAAERGDEPDEDEAAAEEEKPGRRRGRRGGRTPRPPRARRRSRAPSTTARRATGSGSTRPSPTTRSTPSTGPATGPSW